MNLMAIHIGIIINMLHYIINQLKNIFFSSSQLEKISSVFLSQQAYNRKILFIFASIKLINEKKK